MTNPPYAIEFEIQGYLEMLRNPGLSKKMRERLLEKLADAQRVLRFSAEKKVHVLTHEQRRGHGVAQRLRATRALRG